MKHLFLALLAAPLLAVTPVNTMAREVGIAQAETTAPIAPDRLNAAKQTVAAVFPNGTYARLMEASMGSVMDNVMGSIGDLPLRDLIAATGATQEELDKLGEGTLQEMMAILDPVYEERMKVTMKVMSDQMSAMMTQFEPAFQDGLARAYARRFDTRQLAELNTFFATPTGAAYANESMLLFTHPEVMGKMTEIMPAIMKQMPQIMQAMTEATAHLPQPRKPADLTPAELEKLEALMGAPFPETTE